MNFSCPACDAALRAISYENIEIHSCDSCGGEFLDSQALAHIVRTREATFAADLRADLEDHRPAAGVPDDESKRAVRCPACDNRMNVVNYAGDTGVFIDKCSVCAGVWLDRHELEKIQHLSEKWKDEASEQVREIATRLEDARLAAATKAGAGFQGSRFAFVNAIINRMLDAA